MPGSRCLEASALLPAALLPLLQERAFQTPGVILGGLGTACPLAGCSDQGWAIAHTCRLVLTAALNTSCTPGVGPAQGQQAYRASCAVSPPCPGEGQQHSPPGPDADCQPHGLSGQAQGEGLWPEGGPGSCIPCRVGGDPTQHSRTSGVSDLMISWCLLQGVSGWPRRVLHAGRGPSIPRGTGSQPGLQG